MKQIVSFITLLVAVALANPSVAAEPSKTSTATPEENIRSFYSWYVTGVGRQPRPDEAARRR